MSLVSETNLLTEEAPRQEPRIFTCSRGTKSLADTRSVPKPSMRECNWEEARMQRSRKTLLVSTGLAAAALATALLVYGSVRRVATAHASPAPDLLSALPS